MNISQFGDTGTGVCLSPEGHSQIVGMIGVKNRAHRSVLAEIAKTCGLLGLVKYFKKMRGNGLTGSCFP